MKKFINGFINLVINIVVISVLLLLCFIAFIFFISKSNNIAIEDTVSYIKSFGNEISNLTLIDTNQINIDLSDSNTEDIVNINATNNKFYYNQLDNTEKIIYDALENNIDNLKKNNYRINFSTKFNDLLNQADGQYKLNKSFQTSIDAFFYDHPELFYIDLTKLGLLIRSTSIGPLTTYSVAIEPQKGYNYLSDYFSSQQSVNTAILKVENIKNNLIKKLSNSTNDYEKALIVHDTLVNSLKYNSSGSNTHNIYGALVEKKSVCEGYAKAFKYILDSIDIECILVSGTATNSSNETESHMWNYIKLNNKWYGVDVTWDDPIIIGGSSSKVIRHDYFCKGSNVFDDDHFINNKISDKGKTFSIPKLNNKNYK